MTSAKPNPQKSPWPLSGTASAPPFLPDLPTLIVSGYAEVEGLPPTLPRLAKPFKAADLAASLSVITAAGGGLA